MHIVAERDGRSFILESTNDGKAVAQCERLAKNLNVGAQLWFQGSTEDNRGIRLSAGVFALDVIPTDDESQSAMAVLRQTCRENASAMFFHGAFTHPSGSVSAIILSPDPCS